MKLTLEDLGENTAKWIQEPSNKPLLSYFNRGYFKTRNEVNNLHSSFSPYRIPRGLTKLQVRRRLNNFVKNGCVLDASLMNANRVTLLFNNDIILGTSTTAKRPQTTRQMNKLLRGLMGIRKYPTPTDSL